MRKIYLFKMFNKVFLIGNLTRDPELRYTPAGVPVARFAVAVNRPQGKGREGGVDFINCVVWRRLAEVAAEFLKKGRPVAIEGKLQIRSFENRSGEKKTMTEVVADNMQMLGRKMGTGERSSSGGSIPSGEIGQGEEADRAGDEIPF